MAQQLEQSALEKIIQQILSRNYGGGGGYDNQAGIQQAIQDPSFAAGRALGKLASQGVNSWLNNYNERGRLKAEKQDELTKLFQSQYGDNANAVIDDLKRQGIWDNQKKLDQFDPRTYSYNPSEQTQLGLQHADYPDQKQAAIDKAAPKPDLQSLLGGDNSALGQAVRQQEAWENLPEVNNPFADLLRRLR